MKAPEIGTESSQDVFVGFEADTFDHQHAVTQQTLNPLLLELLQEVGAVAGQWVHGHSTAEPLQSQDLHQNTSKGDTCHNNTSVIYKILRFFV